MATRAADYRRHVLAVAKQHGLDVIGPKRGAPGVLVLDWRSGKGAEAASAGTWQAAAKQLAEYLERHRNPARRRRSSSSTRRRRNGVEVHVDIGSHNARGSRGAKTNPARVRLADVKAAERSFASSPYPATNMETQRREHRWRELVRAYEAQTGRPLYRVNPRRPTRRKATRTKTGRASAAQMRKTYGARALEVAARLRNLARSTLQRAHWSKVIRTLERGTTRRRNPTPALPFAVYQGAGQVAAFRSMPRARLFAQDLANRTGRQVKVKA